MYSDENVAIYLKENLSVELIEFSEEGGKYVRVNLVLDGETISSDYVRVAEDK